MFFRLSKFSDDESSILASLFKFVVVNLILVVVDILGPRCRHLRRLRPLLHHWHRKRRHVYENHQTQELSKQYATTQRLYLQHQSMHCNSERHVDDVIATMW